MMGMGGQGQGGFHPQGQGQGQVVPMQQDQQNFVPGGSLNNMTPQQIQQIQQQQMAQQQQAKQDLNSATLCRLGQETVHEILARTQDLFQILKATQPPDGKFMPGGGADRKPKLQEMLRNIKANFKRLRVIYEKLEENFPSDKVVHFEAEILHKSEQDSPTFDDKRNTESYRFAMEEQRDIVEVLTLKNRQLQDIIDKLRGIIWDVNTMLAMRRE